MGVKLLFRQRSIAGQDVWSGTVKLKQTLAVFIYQKKFASARRPYGIILLGLLLSCLFIEPLQAQEIPTATPDAEGIIYAIVQPNDSLWGIAGRHGLTLAELLSLNNLTEDALIQPGDRLIVGIVASPTPEPTATAAATRLPPTPTQTQLPAPPTVICLVAFTDENADGQRETDEPLQAGVAFTVFTDEAVVGNYVTDGESEPYCLTDLAPGDYQITRSVGRDETLTNSGNRTVILAEGDQVILGFGGFLGATLVATAVPPTQLPAATIGSANATVLPAQTAIPVEGENRAGRSFLIGAGILIGILLMGAAVFLARTRT